MSDKAIRHNNGKLQWSLVHYASLEPMVRVLEFGKSKYGAENWKKGLDRKEILESMQRHLAALMDGEALDKETGMSHMGHIQCNAMFYNYFDSLKTDLVKDISIFFEVPKSIQVYDGEDVYEGGEDVARQIL